MSPSSYLTLCLLSAVVVSVVLKRSETVEVKSSLRMSNSIRWLEIYKNYSMKAYYILIQIFSIIYRHNEVNLSL